MPIARATLTQLSGVGRRSQRAYEKRAGIKAQGNIAIGERSTPEKSHERAWRQGQALFELKDYRGYQGRKGQRYLAWRLPNSYGGSHPQRPKGRQKRINRQLADLFTQGMTGNSGPRVEKRFWPDGRAAARGYCRDPKKDAYWPRQQLVARAHCTLWQVISGGGVPG